MFTPSLLFIVTMTDDFERLAILLDLLIRDLHAEQLHLNVGAQPHPVGAFGPTDDDNNEEHDETCITAVERGPGASQPLRHSQESQK